MGFPRASGILLHPTSLPGGFGIGDLGPGALAWLEFLSASGQGLWQVLPLGPTGYGDSPYQSFSAFAGNPLLVSPERLHEAGLLDRGDLDGAPRSSEDAVAFGPVIEWKSALLDRAARRFEAGAAPALRDPFGSWSREQAAWLDDYALFMALKEAHGGGVWTEWDRGLVRREPAALESARARLEPAVASHRFRQYLFAAQWRALREHARSAGVRIVGDLPIFVAHDSADVWAQQEIFRLDERGRPTHVAGVPPDYFSRTGQRWGNPLYRWDVLERRGYDWWLDRFRATLAQVDVVRLDHFRGFEASWEIPADAPTAETGRWVKGPGARFFDAVRGALGALPVIAEDLGVITPEVLGLRDRFELPGMKVLQFAFSGPDNPFLPHRHVRKCAVYSGTHDNDTTRGWYATAPESERHFARRYLGSDGQDIAWDLIRAAFASVAETAIVPLQDVLDLGSEARMNLPGRPSGNWSWRVRSAALSAAVRDRLRDLAELYGRWPVTPAGRA
jgi:4-alpha-glucanotransferase